MLRSLIFLLYSRSIFCAPSLERVVYPTVLEAREGNGEKVLKIDESLTLRLEKSSIVAENFQVKSFDGDQEVITMLDGKKFEENLYHNSEHMASVTILQNGDSFEVEGILSHKLRIRPSPAAERSVDGRIAHTIFEVEKPAGHDVVVNPQTVIEERQYSWRTTTIPETFIVEVLAVCGEAFVKSFNTEQDLIIYLVVLFNSANLRFTTMTSPKITFRLVGISKPYDYQVMHKVSKYIDESRTLDKMKRYVAGAHPEVDVAVLITIGDLATCETYHCSESGTLGIAYLAGVCEANRVALVEDRVGLYTADHVAAHEIAHSLGSDHDGQDPVYRGDPGTKSCPWKDGYLMSYVDGGARHHRPSPCTMRQIRYVLKTRKQDCFDIKSKINHMTKTSHLPGHRINATKFCKDYYKGLQSVIHYSDPRRETTCYFLCCVPTHGGYRCSSHATPNGMSCGYKRQCLSGICRYSTTVRNDRV